jgi:hypothetical protein
VATEALAGPGRERRLTRAWAGLAYLWCHRAGKSERLLAAALGLSHQAISAAAARGEALACREGCGMGLVAIVANVPDAKDPAASKVA